MSDLVVTFPAAAGLLVVADGDAVVHVDPHNNGAAASDDFVRVRLTSPDNAAHEQRNPQRTSP